KQDLNIEIKVKTKQKKQDCSKQLENLEELRRKNTSTTIGSLISERKSILQDEIETKFKSTHQYIHLRAPDEDRLNTVLQLLKQQTGQGLFRYMSVITGEHLLDRLVAFYSLAKEK